MTQPKESTGVQAVLLALEILEHVAVQREPIGVTALAGAFRKASASGRKKIQVSPGLPA